MPLVDRLERKFGWIAVPGIVKIIMGLQALVWLLCSFRGDYALLEKIVLHKELILNGEVWRLFSFVIMPPIEPGSNGIIFMLFAVFFSIFLGSMLESIWGSFRLTLYLIGGAAGMVIAEFLYSFSTANKFLVGTNARAVYSLSWYEEFSSNRVHSICLCSV
ncbi:MAG: hypothetical protein ACJ0K4_11630 [Verrucomicrobiales bacterium]